MSFLNLNYQLLIYEDGSTKNPNVRQPDISKEIKQVPVNAERTEKVTLYPGDITTLSTTGRSLAWDNTTQLSFSKPYAEQDVVRLSWTGTGTNPAFRTKRAIGGDATTTISITRVTPYVARISVTAGTAWTLGTVQVGDIIKFEKTTQTFTSPFSETNQGLALQIQAKGVTYVDVSDNGLMSLDSAIVLGSVFAEAIKMFTQSPVKLHDTLYIASSLANPSNQGKFSVTDVSPDYIEFINPLFIPETVLYDSGFVVYNYLIGFVLIRATDRIQVRFGSQTEWADLQKLGPEAVMLCSVGTHKIEARNNSSIAVEVTVHTAETMVV